MAAPEGSYTPLSKSSPEPQPGALRSPVPVPAPAPAAAIAGGTGAAGGILGAAFAVGAVLVSLGAGIWLDKGRPAPPPSPAGSAIFAPQAPEPVLSVPMPAAAPKELAAGGPVGAAVPESSPAPVASAEYRGIETSVSEAFTPEPPKAAQQELVPLKEMPVAQTAAPVKPYPRLSPMGNVSGYLTGHQQSTAYYAANGRSAQADARGPARGPRGNAGTMGGDPRDVIQGAIEALRRAGARSRAAGGQGNTVATTFQSGGAGGTRVAAGDERTTAPQPNPGSGFGAGTSIAQRVSLGRSTADQAAARFGSLIGKSVIIYVAPWCHFCHSGIPEIQAMRSDLASRGIKTVVVVGQDTPENMRALATEIGGSVVVDSSNSNPMHGVPAYLAANNGRVTSAHMGLFNSSADGVAWAESH